MANTFGLHRPIPEGTHLRMIGKGTSTLTLTQKTSIQKRIPVLRKGEFKDTSLYYWSDGTKHRLIKNPFEISHEWRRFTISELDNWWRSRCMALKRPERGLSRQFRQASDLFAI